MRRKIYIYLAIIFVFFAIGIQLSVISINDATQELNRVIGLHKVEQLRRSLIIDIQAVQQNLYTVRDPDKMDLDEIVANMINLEERVKECSSCHHAPRLSNRIIQLQSKVESYSEILSYYITGRSRERLIKLQEEAVELGDQIVHEAENMSHFASKNLAKLTQESNEDIQGIKKVLVITMLLTLFLSFLLAVFLARSVTKPIKKLLDATRKISSGQLGSKVSYEDKTEFGELAENFNEMSFQLQQREKALFQSTEELKKRIKELEEFYEIAVGRELRMKDLKKEIEGLKLELAKFKDKG
jgi:methyl-accepting chemotaxis protein